MSDREELISDAFKVFHSEASAHAQAWMAAVQGLDGASALDGKTKHLSYLAVLAALGRASGVPFHAQLAKQAGATRAEVISAILVGLPAAGHVVTQSLPPALDGLEAD